MIRLPEGVEDLLATDRHRFCELFKDCYGSKSAIQADGNMNTPHPSPKKPATAFSRGGFL